MSCQKLNPATEASVAKNTRWRAFVDHFIIVLAGPLPTGRIEVPENKFTAARFIPDPSISEQLAHSKSVALKPLVNRTMPKK